MIYIFEAKENHLIVFIILEDPIRRFLDMSIIKKSIVMTSLKRQPQFRSSEFWLREIRCVFEIRGERLGKSSIVLGHIYSTFLSVSRS